MRFMPLAILAVLPTTARAESFPLDLFAVQPIGFVSGSEITLNGAIHCRQDGATLDGLTSSVGSRALPGGVLDAAAGGLRVVWRDPEQHVYRMVATGGSGPGCELAGVTSPCLVPRTLEMAQARLMTVAEFAESLAGEVTVECPDSAGVGFRLAMLAHTPWEYGLAATGPFIALAGWFWLRKRRRRVPTPSEEIDRLAAAVIRRLRQGDPVHQRLLAPVRTLVDHAHRLEHERRRGVAEGWPAETERSTRGLQAILQSLRGLAGTLDEATRTGRAALDGKLLRDLHRDLQIALAASAETDGLLEEHEQLA